MNPEIFEIINCFKNRCQLKGLETLENSNIVKSEGKYHNFIWIRELHPPTFERVAKHEEYAISDGVSFRIIKVSYTAWICMETSCKSLMQIMAQNPEILRKNAVYDLSRVKVNGICSKLNKTKSDVFRDFELFLTNQLGIKPCSGFKTRNGNTT